MEKYKYIFTDTYILFTVKGYDVDISHAHTYMLCVSKILQR